MNYKRDPDRKWKMRLGDLEPEYAGNGERQRYNVNDSGDIYFLQSDYANSLMGESWSYIEDSRRESRGFQRKDVKEAISRHHDLKKVTDIVRKYFEIA